MNIFQALSDKGYSVHNKRLLGNPAYTTQETKDKDFLQELGLVLEWFRVIHGIWVYVDTHQYGKWCFNYKKIKPHKDYPVINVNGEFGLEDYDTPQEAYSAAFDYIKDNNLI